MTERERELPVAPHPIGHHATCASVGNPDLIACDCEVDNAIVKAYANGMDKAETQIVEWLRGHRNYAPAHYIASGIEAGEHRG